MWRSPISTSRRVGRAAGSIVVKYFVYILESESTGKWYYGSTSDVCKRVSDHNKNRSTYAKNKGPWTLIFVRKFDSKSDALKFELYLKKTRNKSFIKKEFGDYFDVSSYRDVAQSG